MSAKVVNVERENEERETTNQWISAKWHDLLFLSLAIYSWLWMMARKTIRQKWFFLIKKKWRAQIVFGSRFGFFMRLPIVFHQGFEKVVMNTTRRTTLIGVWVTLREWWVRADKTGLPGQPIFPMGYIYWPGPTRPKMLARCFYKRKNRKVP